MAKHVVTRDEDEQTITVPATSRDTMPELLNLLQQAYAVLGQAPPAHLAKALRRARSGSMVLSISVNLQTEHREGRAAQLRRLLLQQESLKFKKRMNQEAQRRIQRDILNLAVRKRNLKRARKQRESEKHSVDHRLTKTRLLVTRVRTELAETAARKAALPDTDA